MSEYASDHEWAVARLPAFASGLLSQGVQARFEAHAATCTTCQELLTRLRRAHVEYGHHVPRRVLLDWKTEVGRMKGLQRKLVLQHVASCEECQAVLEHLGIDPKQVPDRPVVVRPVWVRRDFWFGTGVGGLGAAAAAVVIALLPNPRDRGPAEVGVTPSIVVHAPSVGTVTSVPEPVRLFTARSRGSKRAIVRPSADRHAISLFVQPSDLTPGQQVSLSILLGDSVVVKTMLEPADFGEDRRLLWRSPSTILPGDYSLILATPARAETLSFEVSEN